MKFRFNQIKNDILLQERGINFDSISEILISDQFIIITDHTNPTKYPKQKLIYLEKDGEVYTVPCVVEENGTFFLKTIFPNRKARKEFLNKKPRLLK